MSLRPIPVTRLPIAAFASEGRSVSVLGPCAPLPPAPPPHPPSARKTRSVWRNVSACPSKGPAPQQQSRNEPGAGPGLAKN